MMGTTKETIPGGVCDTDIPRVYEDAMADRTRNAPDSGGTAAERKTGADELEQRLWAIIDRDGLADVPSDIVGAVARLKSLAESAPPAPAASPACGGEVAWMPIVTADKDDSSLMLGIFRQGVLSEIHIGGYRYALNDDEASCWWSDQADDEICPTHWLPLPGSSTLASPEQGEVVRDKRRLDALREESWDLRCFDIPTGQGDADIGWRVIGHYMAKPHERTIGEVFHDDPRAALDAALAKIGGAK